MPEGAVIRADTGRNTIVVTGSAQELQAMQETISIFDVDWMRGMSFGLYPVKSGDPTAVVQDLESIFSTKSGPLKGVVRFLPNQRLNSILVISARQRYLKEAASWIARLDRAARSKEANLHVYNVQNRSAGELASVLQKVFKTKAGGNVSVEQVARVAPKLAPVVTSTDVATGEVGSKSDLMQNPDVNADQPTDTAQPQTEAIPEDTEAPEAPSRYAKPPDVSIVADDSNNSLLIIATDDEYDRMLRVLKQIDSSPNQVLLEATIAEVVLNDNLRFGVRWFFGEPDNRGTFSDLFSGAVANSFPGFSYFFSSGNDIRASVSALAAVTKVHVLSSPTLMVLDNRTATLQVGDQVPIISQQATSVAAPGAPVVNTVELKDTGVILSVTPRVNDSGRVVLDIKQEVSDVVPTRTSRIDSPTIRQRKITTTVVVNDGDTLALGGLIQERSSIDKTKVPVFGDIPLLGTAFREKTDELTRTELVIFIRPRVVRDISEARRVTQEFRDQMQVEAPRVPNTRTKMGQDLIRILQ
jgi:general secretion pathway protein D